MSKNKSGNGIRTIGLVAILLAVYFSIPQISASMQRPADDNQRSCDTINKPGDPDLTPRPNPGITKVIHLTDRGLFSERCALTDAMYELNWDVPKEHGPEVKQEFKGTNLPRLTVMYVHGWRHDDNPSLGDLKHFSKWIEELQEHYNKRKQVVGIYVSWNASIGLRALDINSVTRSAKFFVESVTFWSKKSIADRISQSGTLARIVASIGVATKKDASRTDQFVAIGHSFGARILFDTINPILLADASAQHPGKPGGTYGKISSSTDAVILLNPAFEASLFTALDSLTKRKEFFAMDQAPLLISIATDADKATRWAFPVGQVLGGARHPTDLTTLGNHSKYFTHDLFLTSKTVECPASSGSRAGISEVFASDKMCLARKAGGSRNPFIIASTGADVIDGHNDIWNEKFRNWMLQLIQSLSAASE